MSSYPIWNKITACIYKGGKSYGVRKNGEVEVLVGSSASNSHNFVSHSVTHRKLENGDRSFHFYVDGSCLKKALLKKGASEIEIIK